jgi:hypothetical protein
MAHHYSWADEVDPWQEHCDYEANARYDYAREAWGSELDAEYEANDDRDEGSFGPWLPIAEDPNADRPF